MSSKHGKSSAKEQNQPVEPGSTKKNQPALPPYIQETEAGWYILLKVQPGARKTELCGEIDGSLRVRLNAPAVENKANGALLEFMAQILGVKKNKPVLASGDKSRMKKVFISREAAPRFDLILNAPVG